MTKLKRASNLFLILVFTAAALSAASPAVNAGKAGMDPGRLARIPVRMQSFVDKGTIAGTVTLVARHGAVASLEAVGFQDLESKKPMRADTIFQIMSMTKPVTAVGIMMLEEEGKLAVGDPVEKYLPEFRGMWVVDSRDGDKARSLVKPSRLITIRDLLTHTSGLYANNPPAMGDLKAWMAMPLAQVVAIGSQQPLDFQPGVKWQYSNIGIATLGRIIEVVADQPFEKFMESRIFQPLGMKDSYFFPPAEKFDRIASCYELDHDKLKKMGEDTLGGGALLYRKGARNPLPEGGIYSTAADMAAFYQMMLNGGTYNGARLLSRSTVQVMTAIHTGDLDAGHSAGMGYGLAWAIARLPVAQVTLPLVSIGTYGHGGAFGTQGWVDPAKDLVGVFLVQRPAANTERNAFMAIANSALVD